MPNPELPPFQNAIPGKAADTQRRLNHRIQRIADHDQDTVGRFPDCLFGHALHDVVVGLEQVVTAHAGLAGNTGRDYHHVGTGGLVVAVGAREP